MLISFGISNLSGRFVANNGHSAGRCVLAEAVQPLVSVGMLVDLNFLGVKYVLELLILSYIVVCCLVFPNLCQIKFPCL